MIKILTKVAEMGQDKGLSKLKVMKNAKNIDKTKTEEVKEKNADEKEDDECLDALNEIFARMSMDTRTKVTQIDKFAMTEPNDAKFINNLEASKKHVRL
jgi:hypothetical protein